MSLEEIKALLKSALESIAPTLPQVLGFHLEKKLGKNVIAILLANPRAVYGAFLELNNNIEDQTDNLIIELVSAISGKYNINIDPYEVLDALKENNSQKIERIARQLVNSNRKNLVLKGTQVTRLS